jgi:hypothetical protein
MSKNTQKEPWFLKINPNGRIPAITDTFTDGETIRVFESGSIMQYLVERYDKDHKISFPADSREHVEVRLSLPVPRSGKKLIKFTGCLMDVFFECRSWSDARTSQPLPPGNRDHL